MEKSRYLKAREQRGIKLPEAAVLLGVDERDLESYERGNAQPDELLVGQMAMLYQKTSDWLIGLEG